MWRDSRTIRPLTTLRWTRGALLYIAAYCSGRSRQALGGSADWLATQVGRLSPRALAFSIGAVVAVIVVQSALLVTFSITSYDPSGFQTASMPRSGEIGIGFVPAANAADITKFLDTYHLTIVEGPRPGGLFMTRPESAPLPKDRLDHLVRQIQQEGRIVRFAAVEDDLLEAAGSGTPNVSSRPVPSAPMERAERPGVPENRSLDPAAPTGQEDAAAAILRERGKKLRLLPEGKIVLLAPTKIKVGERRKIEARVGLNVPIETLQKRLDPQDQKIEGPLRVSTEMLMVLDGPGFTIEAITPEQQAIAEGFATVWSWNVKANVDGEQELEATLYALMPSARQRIDSYTQKISVSVREQTWGEWLDSVSHEVDAVKAIAVAVITATTAGVGWLSVLLSRRRKEVNARPTHKARHT
jgi:hypothetical protein